MNKFISFVLLAIVLILSNQPVTSQENLSGKQFYVEFGGPGVMFSANFDSRFKNGEFFGFGYRVGVGFNSYDNNTDYNVSSSSSSYRTYCTIPLGLNYIFGKKTSLHAFEVGAGITVLTRKVDIFYDDQTEAGHLVGHFSFLYRRQPMDGGFTWRIGFVPIIGASGDLYPSGLIGIGYAF